MVALFSLPGLDFYLPDLNLDLNTCSRSHLASSHLVGLRTLTGP